MTREEAIKELKYNKEDDTFVISAEVLDMAIKALEQDPCEDVISRQAVLDLLADYDLSMGQVVKCIHALPPVTSQPKTGHCKDCKWWKDSDGAYRRGVRAENRCPINRIEVFEGNGYCYMFEPQVESEVMNETSKTIIR